VKNVFCIASFFCVFNLFAQDSKFSITLSYPYPFDKNFVGTNYTGVLDLGVQYRFVDAGLVKIGASMNGSYLVFPDNPAPQVNKINATFIQPRVFGELSLPSLDKFSPTFGIGYTFTSFKGNFVLIEGPGSFKENYNGLNLNLGFFYDITDRFFTHLHYDFIKVSSAEGAPDVKQNTNINLIKIGVGFRL